MFWQSAGPAPDYFGRRRVAQDTIFYASDIEKNGWEVRLPLESLGQQVMIIYIDIYGNEYWEIKTPARLL